jgi:hypothetical protein
MAGVAMGQRTSSNEAQIAKTAASRPHMKNARYILHTWLSSYARKMIRYWEVFSTDEQIAKITDRDRIVAVQPAGLMGDFDVEVTIVDDYVNKYLDRDTWSYAARNVLPLFADVFDHRKLAIKVCDRTLGVDITDCIKPDVTAESTAYAHQAIEELKMRRIPPLPDTLDLDVIQAELQGERILWRGAEDTAEGAWVVMLDQMLEQIAFKKEQQPKMLPGGSAPTPGPQMTEGQVAGNQIAAQLGAEAGA